MLDKQSCSNYTQLLLQMKRIKANESHTGPAQGLPNEERVRDGEGSVCEGEKVFVCLRHARTIL